MKKLVSLVLALLMAFSMLAVASAEEPTITVLVNYTDVKLEVFQSIIEAFTAETGVKVDLITPGGDSETQLKTMMAANAVPDVWTTHGWSLIRYSEYLMPVNDQPWFDTMDTASLGGVMADENGNFYALGISMSMSGLIYNKDILDAVGIDPTTLTTWTAFEDACDKIIAAGYTPIAVGGSASGNLAGLLGSVAPTFWTDAGAKYDLGASLKDGTFDFDTYGTELYAMLADWIKAGYFNVDILTLDSTGAQQLLGAGKAAFMMRGTDNITIARTYYPDANLGILPMPASADGKPSFRIGEGDAYGVWKDTKNADACWELLAYLARPEVAGMMDNVQGSSPTIQGVVLQDSYAYDAYLTAQKQCGDNIQYDNVFDRKFFPSGMWGIMGTSLSMLIDNPDDVAGAVEFLKENYIDLYKAAH